MIENIHISNYALIDNVDIVFDRGFNIITGETGAGKSIILGAMSLLLGGRAETRVLRDSSRKAVVEAEFSVDGREDLKQFCLENEIEWDDTSCLLRREIAPTGRSRAFINDSPVNLDQLKSVALKLVDIHSQHQNLLLASPPYQLQIIDVLALNESRMKEYAVRFDAYRKAVKDYVMLKREIEKANADEEFMRYQLAQIDNLKPIAGEQEDLERERELIANMTDVKESLRAVVDALDDDSPSALSLIKDAAAAVARISGVVEEADSLGERIEAVRVELQDIAETFADYDRNLNADPLQLEQIENRLNDIYDLERRHHVESVEQLIELAENLRSRLTRIDNADEMLKEYQQKARQAKAHAMETAREISSARKEEASRFAEMLRERAIPLGMKNLNVRVDVTPAEMSVTGIDNVEFFFSFNKNQEPLPVGKTASGGEISRLMLSIKSIVADKMELPSIIFDEVDTGVSGDVANRMGDLMQLISRNIQVIAITHLPQVAAKGDAHFKVFKEDTETTTNTHIKTLGAEERIDELAVMLSGSSVDDAARANARSLLESNK